MEFKINIGDKAGKSYKIILKEPEAANLIGLKIGSSFNGSVLGLNGYEFKITGGSDNAGFPMRKEVMGSRRVRILTGKSVGLKKVKQKGWRRRKTFRGNTIADDIAQINVIAVKQGKKKLKEIFGKKAPAAKEEKKEKLPKEEKSSAKEEKKEEKKKKSPKEEKPAEEKKETLKIPKEKKKE